ncbi:MAG: shikimate dehydrogenase [Paludibacteraceae bacterium]|nr:shikimate dehydrogenase [Paludibacteraceae bacterium]
MKHFGIIGKPLRQSFSAKHFNEKFAREGIDAEYSLYPLERIEEFSALLERVSFAGMNVTIPYKSEVIPYLTTLDETAKEIGAVNVIQFSEDGRTVGYNTDALGFIESIRPMLKATDKEALVLGTGGAAKACRYGLEKLGLQVTNVSRTPKEGQLDYKGLELGKYQVIVNCTPLGMFPETEDCPPIRYEELSPAQFLFDCIYNPEETVFLKEGRLRGCRTQNGMGMLMGQAKAAWRIWRNL